MYINLFPSSCAFHISTLLYFLKNPSCHVTQRAFPELTRRLHSFCEYHKRFLLVSIFSGMPTLLLTPYYLTVYVFVIKRPSAVVCIDRYILPFYAVSHSIIKVFSQLVLSFFNLHCVESRSYYYLTVLAYLGLDIACLSPLWRRSEAWSVAWQGM